MNCLTNKLGYAKPQMRPTPLGTPFAPATPHITHFSLPSPSPRLPKSKRAFSRIQKENALRTDWRMGSPPYRDALFQSSF